MEALRGLEDAFGRTVLEIDVFIGDEMHPQKADQEAENVMVGQEREVPARLVADDARIDVEQHFRVGDLVADRFAVVNEDPARFGRAGGAQGDHIAENGLIIRRIRRVEEFFHRELTVFSGDRAVRFGNEADRARFAQEVSGHFIV